MSTSENNFITFNFDVSAYRLLGRELITDRITALFEIVKNSYDANADEVELYFEQTQPLSSNSKIIIKDDGLGMDLDDLKYKWMVVGTSSKRKQRTSPKPYSRKVVGKKGIGRFAVDLLGSKLKLKTKKKGADKWIILETDWTQYAKLEKYQLELPFDEEREFFTDIKNKYWFEPASLHDQGTVLEISTVNEAWTENDVTRAYRELSKLVSPNEKILHPFSIKIFSQFPEWDNIPVKTQPITNFATIALELKYLPEKNLQQVAIFNKGSLEITEVPCKSFGPINYHLYYFDQRDKKRFRENVNIAIDGVKIYRDGLITTPFAESEANSEKKKDVIGIDKRRYSGFFDRISNRDLLGYIELKDELNPKIVETTNRQDFLDTSEWKDLKDFIIDQIHQIEKYLSSQKDKLRNITKYELVSASDELKNIRKSLTIIKSESTPKIKEVVLNIESDLSRLQGTVNKSISDYARLEDESRRKESMFFSLVSLQTYASMFSHMARHTIGHIIRDAEYFKNNFPNENLNDRFKIISERIYNELIKLRVGVGFMLKYAQSDNEIEDINLYEIISTLLFEVYKDIFVEEQISPILELKDNLIIRYNKKAIEDIFDNLISNSIKALKGVADKKIKCSGIATNNSLELYFSDNGNGIREQDKHRIFEIFYTTTAETGGAGMGLYMVRTQIESMQGEISVVSSEFGNGATFKIVLPFNK